MKNSMKFFTMLMVAAVTFLFVEKGVAQPKAWPVPAGDKSMKAPVKLTDQTVIDNGKDLWAKHCKACHGTKGLGDGPKAAALKTKVPSFADAAFKSQTDGELFYKTSKGRDEMPAYDKKLPEANDRWGLIAYMRTLSK
ncbi:MAG: cytochrome c [Bacteroidetes bacterium]|nr:cytochrome c [Bacteroidota bacterium]